MMIRKIFTLIAAALLLCVGAPAYAQESVNGFPREIRSGEQGRNHVQGIAYDARRGCVYMSFTTSLVKLDLQGRLLSRVTGLTGHLGCLAMDVEGDRLYASLEYKHDVIGAGIAKGLGVENDAEDGFYVVSFDLDAITEPEMDAAQVMKAVYVREAVQDYKAMVENGGREWAHRHGCSGIDGVAVTHAPGKRGKRVLYVAYGVYGEKERTDNDYQVLLCYDLEKLRRYEQPLNAINLHQSGPKTPAHKYFVYTGNTSFGIQNLAYDPALDGLVAAVYPGQKAGRENFGLYAIDLSTRARKDVLVGVEPRQKGEQLPLLKAGRHDEKHDVWGWHFGYGSTGLCPLGNGLYYVSHNARNPKTGGESCTAVLYRWTGMPDAPLVRVE